MVQKLYEAHYKSFGNRRVKKEFSDLEDVVFVRHCGNLDALARVGARSNQTFTGIWSIIFPRRRERPCDVLSQASKPDLNTASGCNLKSVRKQRTARAEDSAGEPSIQYKGRQEQQSNYPRACPKPVAPAPLYGFESSRFCRELFFLEPAFSVAPRAGSILAAPAIRFGLVYRFRYATHSSPGFAQTPTPDVWASASLYHSSLLGASARTTHQTDSAAAAHRTRRRAWDQLAFVEASTVVDSVHDGRHSIGSQSLLYLLGVKAEDLPSGCLAGAITLIVSFPNSSSQTKVHSVICYNVRT
jgi:hypothetical protein